MPSSRSRREIWSALARVALLLGAGWFVFSPAAHGGWLWDDTLDVTGNTLLRSAHGLWQIWFQPRGLYDYYPLKFSVQWLQWHLWHDDTTGYHLTNLALHLASAVLVGRILVRLGVRHGWLGGLLFAVHPLTVESVAYITELKNTLSLPLLLLAFAAWLDFDSSGQRADYASAAGLFVAALLCKTSGVMLPFVLLLHAWWKRGRVVRQDVRRTVPFFAAALVLGVVTIWFQRHVAIGDEGAAFDPIGSFGARFLGAGACIVFYFAKAVVPVGLAPVYPQWSLQHPSLLVWLAWPAIAGVAVLCWRHREGWGRHALFGLGWFFLFLLPVIGLVPISSQRFTWVMDHLAYLPLVGLVGLGGAAVSAGAARRAGGRGPLILTAGLVAAGALAWVSRAHAEMFASEEALWRGAIRQQPRAWFGYFNLGNWQRHEHRLADAIASYQRAAAVQPPGVVDVEYNLANTLRAAGRGADAIAAYRAALHIQPAFFLAHANLAVALAEAGRTDDAIAECRAALAIKPDYAEAQLNLALLLVRARHPAEAIPEFETLLRTQPNSLRAHYNLALALAEVGRRAEALEHYARARALDPSLPPPSF